MPSWTCQLVRVEQEVAQHCGTPDPRMIVSMVDWLMDRCQDAIVTEELDPGLFGYHTQPPEVRDLRVREFVELLRGAVGAR